MSASAPPRRPSSAASAADLTTGLASLSASPPGVSNAPSNTPSTSRSPDQASAAAAWRGGSVGGWCEREQAAGAGGQAAAAAAPGRRLQPGRRRGWGCGESPASRCQAGGSHQAAKPLTEVSTVASLGSSVTCGMRRPATQSGGAPIAAKGGPGAGRRARTGCLSKMYILAASSHNTQAGWVPRVAGAKCGAQAVARQPHVSAARCRRCRTPPAAGPRHTTPPFHRRSKQQRCHSPP